MMDQSGGVLRRNPLAENKLMMGVTTAIGGEGGTPVPAREIPQYFQQLEQQGISINFGTYFSQTQARNAVLGNVARAPTADELRRMRAIVDTAMRAKTTKRLSCRSVPPIGIITEKHAIVGELSDPSKSSTPSPIFPTRGDGGYQRKGSGQVRKGQTAIVMVGAFRI